MQLAGTYDIECAEWDRFVLGVTYQPDDIRIWRDPDEMIDHLRATGGTWAAHAGGIYDAVLVADRLTQRGIKYQADEAQHRITRLTSGGAQLRDSYALYPFGLEVLCGQLGRDAAKLPWPCTCGRACGGYCRIAEHADSPELEAYCVADCQDLYEGLCDLARRASCDGIDLRGTLGNTAWRTAQAALGLPDAGYPTWDVWRRIRRADYAGRTACFRATADRGAHHDLVNAYPSALARAELPVGDLCELGPERAARALELGMAGLYTATVHIPVDLFVPPLPWRLPSSGRTVYPVGTITGTWVLPELVAALERGVQILELESATVWESAAPIFGGLIADWYAIRKRAGRDSPYGQWISALAKALCGKLAEGPERRRLLAYPDKIRLCTRTGGCRRRCTGRCRRYEAVDLHGRIWSAPYWSLPPSAHVEWSAYLRAHTRLQWLAEAEQFGIGDLVYGNTDSLWTTGSRQPSPIGDELGHWRREHGWSDWQCRGIGVYRCLGEDGQPIVRGAGTTALSDADWQRGHGEIDRGVTTFVRAARTAGEDRRIFRRKLRRWTLPQHPATGLYGDRRLSPVDGVTYPLDAAEWLELDKPRRNS